MGVCVGVCVKLCVCMCVMFSGSDSSSACHGSQRTFSSVSTTCISENLCGCNKQGLPVFYVTVTL